MFLTCPVSASFLAAKASGESKKLTNRTSLLAALTNDKRIYSETVSPCFARLALARSLMSGVTRVDATSWLRTCLVYFKNYLQEGQYNHLKTAVKGTFTIFPKSPTFV